MQDKENYLNLKLCTRVNEDSMSFTVEGTKYEFEILTVNNNFSLIIKDTSNSNPSGSANVTGTSYSTKLLITDFQINEIFKNNPNPHSVKETIFKIIMNSLAKIKFIKPKCFINLSSIVQDKQKNFIIELNEDLNMPILIHNLTKRIDDLEKINKLFKLENEKLKSDLINLRTYKENEIRELKELDLQKKEEIFAMKNNLEKINLIINSNKFLINPYQDLLNLNLNSNESEARNMGSTNAANAIGANTIKEREKENTNFFNSIRSNKSNSSNIFGINQKDTNENNNKTNINSPNANLNQNEKSQSRSNLKNNLNVNNDNTQINNNNILNTINESRLSSLKCLTNENVNVNTNPNNQNSNTQNNNNNNNANANNNNSNNNFNFNSLNNKAVADFITSKNVVGNSNSGLNVNTIGSNIPKSPPDAIRRQVEEMNNTEIKNLKTVTAGNSPNLNLNLNMPINIQDQNNDSFNDFNLDKQNEMEKSKIENNKSINYKNTNANKSYYSNNTNLQFQNQQNQQNQQNLNQQLSQLNLNLNNANSPQMEKRDFNVINSSPILAGNKIKNNQPQKDLYDFVLNKEMNMNNNPQFLEREKEEIRKINMENSNPNLNANHNSISNSNSNQNPEEIKNFNSYGSGPNFVHSRNNLVTKDAKKNEGKNSNNNPNPNHNHNQLVEWKLNSNNNNDNIVNSNSNVNPLFTFSSNINSPKFQMGIKPQINYNNLNNNNINANNNTNNINNNNIKIQENLNIFNEEIINKENSQNSNLKEMHIKEINNNNNNNLKLNHIIKNNELVNFISNTNTPEIYDYNYTELFLKKPISNFKLENNIKFFYQVNKGEISETTLWCPFDEEDCILLELHYPNYLIGGPCEIFLEKMNKVVNFKYMMLVDAENSENHIHIKRSLPNKIKNIVRKNRYNFDEIKTENLLKNKVISSINTLKDFNKYADYFTIFEFNFIKNHSFDVKIPKKFEYLYKECIKKNNYGAFVVSLREEIESLRKFYEKSESVFLSYLDNMENSPKFFQIVLQMYSEDGFLNGELNKVLRKPNLENLDKIKYFYLAVLVSLTFCSINVRPKIDFNNNNNNKENEILSKSLESNKYLDKNLKREFDTSLMSNKNLKAEKNLFIYSPYKISNTEMDYYKSNIFNILFFDEFISSTPNKQKAENYLKAFKSIETEFTEFNFKGKLKGKNANKTKRKKYDNDIDNDNDYDNDNESNNESNNQNNNNKSSESNNNISAILEIEIPYYMLENDNTHIDTLAFTYDDNFTLFPQEEEVILKSGTIFMLKGITQNTKEAYSYTISLVALSFSWKGFFDGLAYNKLTKEINLNKNGIGNFRKSVKYLCEALVKNNNIETLSLKENNFGENLESMKYLANLIAINDIKELAANLLMKNKQNNNSTNNTNINQEDYNYILNYYKIQNPKDVEFIRNSLPKIKILDLGNNSIGKNSNITKIFCEALQLNQNIKYLDLNSNNFSDVESSKYLASALVSNKFIENLDLSLNNLGLNLLAANYLSEAFLINQNLQILNLSENNLGERPDIVKSLFEAIGRNKNLRKLNISGNSFGVNSISVRYLVEGIIFNEGIFELNLSNNLLGNMESLTYLCALLEKNSAIEILDLSKNKFGVNKESYTLLGEGLAKAKYVNTLNLANNNLNNHADYLKSLLDAILSNGNLKKVNFSYNSLSNCEDFKDFLKKMNREKNINYIGNNNDF